MTEGGIVRCLIHWCQWERPYNSHESELRVRQAADTHLLNHTIGQVAYEIRWLHLQLSPSATLPPKPTPEHPFDRAELERRLAEIQRLVALD